MRAALAGALVALVVLGTVACQQRTDPPTGPTSTVVTTVVTTNGPVSGPTTPTPGTPTPTSGSHLPLPAYAEGLVRAAAATPTGAQQIAQSCYLQFPSTAFSFLDSVVDRLRALDPRWGYACYLRECGLPSNDTIAYFATENATPTAGATGIWQVTVIAGYCTAPTVTYQSVYDAGGRWTSRGRF